MKKKIIKKERKTIEVRLTTPFSNREVATLVVVSDAVSISPLIIEKILEEQIRRVLENVMMCGLYTMEKPNN